MKSKIYKAFKSGMSLAKMYNEKKIAYRKTSTGELIEFVKRYAHRKEDTRDHLETDGEYDYEICAFGVNAHGVYFDALLLTPEEYGRKTDGFFFQCDINETFERIKDYPSSVYEIPY